MKKELLILVIFFLCLCSINTDTDCSDFEASKQKDCASLTNADQYCYYDSDTDVCQRWYQDCTEYNPESGFDENICKKIAIPSSDTEYSNKKCGVVSGANGKKSCQRVYKECKELLTQDLCISNLELGLGPDKRCVWSEDKCELHYKSCTDDNIKTQIFLMEMIKTVFGKVALAKKNIENVKTFFYILKMVKPIWLVIH